MNQPSSLKSLDHLDTSSDSSDSQSECESITIPDPNNPDTVQRFIDSTTPHREPKIEQVSIINSQDVHIGTRHSFHFHGVPLPSKPINEEPNGNADLETNTPWTSVKSAQNLHQSRLRYVLVPSIIVLLLLALTTTLAIFKDSLLSQTFMFNSINPNTSVYIEKYPVYYRENWGGLQQAGSPPLNVLPTSVIIISHTATEPCSSFEECSNLTQSVQYTNLKSGEPDVGYNFLIGGEGGIYVGRGWTGENFLKTNSVAVAFIGDFNKYTPKVEAEKAGKALIAEGLKLGVIADDYKLIGENQTSPLRFYSPGRKLMALIKNWDHYFSGTQVQALPGDPPPRNVLKRLKFFFMERSMVFWLAGLVMAITSITSLTLFLCFYNFNPTQTNTLAGTHSDNLGDDIQIIQRSNWLARPPLNVTKLDHPLGMVRIMHTGGSYCDDYQTCANKVLALQGWQVTTQNLDDISYNFLIGGDGNVYEGRGAGVQNPWRKDAVDVVYIGNYLKPYDNVTDKMDLAGRKLLDRLESQGYLTSDYIVVAQNQTHNTQSPGENVYSRIIKWPHYNSGLYFSN